VGSTAFFATEEEQLPWIQHVLADPNTSCIAQYGVPGRIQRIEPDDLKGLRFSGQASSLHLYLLRSDLAPSPVYRDAGGRRMLDMAASLAVDFVPCMKDGSTLMEGDLGILRHAWYSDAGLDDRPLRKWSRSLQRSLRRELHVPGATLAVCAPGYRAVASTRREVVSRGAIEWWQQGGQLKQHPLPNIVYFEPVAYTQKQGSSRGGSRNA
jgi:hypothetical protein